MKANAGTNIDTGGGSVTTQSGQPPALSINVALAGIPEVLKMWNQWVCWQPRWDSKTNKWAKIPFCAGNLRRKASSTDRNTWSNFEQASACLNRGFGVGFVLTRDDPYSVIDLDHARNRDSGVLSEFSLRVIDRLGSYSEISPSGTGVHIWVEAEKPGNRCKESSIGIEIYDTSRYITMTGNYLSDSPRKILNRQSELESQYREWLGSPMQESGTSKDLPKIRFISDQEIIQRASEANNGSKFRALFEFGDWQGQGYKSQSEADLALCSMLAFWVGPDEGRIEKLFSQSKLGHCEKWLRPDYRHRTISKALEGITEVYGHPNKGDSNDRNISKESRSGGSPGLYLETARHFLLNKHTHQGVVTLRRWANCWWRWDGIKYKESSLERLKAELWKYIKTPTKRKVAEVLDALLACDILIDDPPPCWVDGNGPDPQTLIAVRNGLLDIDTRDLIPHSPRYFNTSALEINFDPKAPPPVRWHKFLYDLWGDDNVSQETVAEIFGYIISGDLSLQKAFIMIGPKRAGKGVICSVLTNLIGTQSVCGPTLSTFADRFGLSEFLGKKLAIFADARLGERVNQAAIIERMLSITGEDLVSIDRKFVSPISVRLGTRILITTNEVPRLVDQSGAFASRFVVLVLTNSFIGREDKGLKDGLVHELPGILLESLDGLDRLRKRGKFLSPDSASEVVAELEDLTSPVGRFLRDCCVVALDAEVAFPKLFTAWKNWCGRNSHDDVGDAQTFGRNLRAACPHLEKATQKRVGREVMRFLKGIGLS